MTIPMNYTLENEGSRENFMGQERVGEGGLALERSIYQTNSLRKPGYWGRP